MLTSYRKGVEDFDSLMDTEDHNKRNPNDIELVVMTNSQLRNPKKDLIQKIDISMIQPSKNDVPSIKTISTPHSNSSIEIQNDMPVNMRHTE